MNQVSAAVVARKNADQPPVLVVEKAG